ncbi:MAG: hypothetical protein IJ017_01535 [Oscillospiraceae bacterium]|nr:hypothetical protein [Oscillospiraceae bacterium]
MITKGAHIVALGDALGNGAHKYTHFILILNVTPVGNRKIKRLAEDVSAWFPEVP